MVLLMTRRLTLLCLALPAVAGCDFVDAVSEVTVGAGKIPRVEVRVALPGADEVLNASKWRGSHFRDPLLLIEHPLRDSWEVGREAL
jgi:hypothetical protein